MLYTAAILAAVLVLALLVLFRRRSGARLLYSDADHGTFRQARPLRAERLGLLAKPDYVYRENGELIVEELKSTYLRGAPYTNHLIQLGVELLVVEEAFGQRPAAGRLRYANRTVPMAFTEDLRQQVLAALARYRSVASGREPPLSTPDVAKCRNCAVRELCQAGLAHHY